MQPVPQQGTAAPEGTTTGQRAEPLGDKLAKSDGVLCPPAGVDPEIRAPTPDTGNTPVIPPPGSPGGDPTVRPEIATFCRHLAERAALLDMPMTGFLYAARSRLRHIELVTMDAVAR